jgi:hypothetical protein
VANLRVLPHDLPEVTLENDEGIVKVQILLRFQPWPPNCKRAYIAGKITCRVG